MTQMPQAAVGGRVAVLTMGGTIVISDDNEDDNEPVCGYSYDHDVDPRDVEDHPTGPWVCQRPECGAELWPDGENET